MLHHSAILDQTEGLGIGHRSFENQISAQLVTKYILICCVPTSVKCFFFVFACALY